MDSANWSERVKELQEEHAKCESFEARGYIIAIYYALMNAVERSLRSSGASDEQVREFQAARQQCHNVFLVTEAVEQNGDVNSEKLLRVTEREIAAGRITPDHRLHQLATAGVTFGIGTSKSLAEVNASRARQGRRPWLRRLLSRLRFRSDRTSAANAITVLINNQTQP